MVLATINYVARGGAHMAYFANDSSRDTVVLVPEPMDIAEAADTTLEREGFVRLAHRSVLPDFVGPVAVARLHPGEIKTLIRDLTGADVIVVTGTGVLRFAERSTLSGALDNSRHDQSLGTRRTAPHCAV